MAFKQYAVPGVGYVNEHNPGHQYALPGSAYLSDTSVIAVSSPGGTTPVEWRNSLTRDASIPVEIAGTPSINNSGSGVIPVEWRNMPGGDIGGGTGVENPGAVHQGIPVEWRTAGGGGGFPVGGDQYIVRQGIPVEWRAATGSSTDSGISGPISLIPVEWRVGGEFVAVVANPYSPQPPFFHIGYGDLDWGAVVDIFPPIPSPKAKPRPPGRRYPGQKRPRRWRKY